MKKITILSLIVFMIDRIFKIIVSTKMTVNSSLTIIYNFLNISYVQNDGAAFSILRGNTLLLILLAIITLILIYYFLIKNNEINKLNIVSYGLLFGGIVGNLFDRILYGYVIDFIDFELFNYHFAIFNIADIAIVVGAFILIIIILKEDKKCKK